MINRETSAVSTADTRPAGDAKFGGVFDEVDLGVDDARKKDHVIGQLVLAQGRVFVLAARVGEFHAQAADVRLIERV